MQGRGQATSVGDVGGEAEQGVLAVRGGSCDATFNVGREDAAFEAAAGAGGGGGDDGAGFGFDDAEDDVCLDSNISSRRASFLPSVRPSFVSSPPLPFPRPPDQPSRANRRVPPARATPTLPDAIDASAKRASSPSR